MRGRGSESEPDVPAGGGAAPFEPWPDTHVHVEWGVPGAAIAAARGDVVVVVDVLSFSTTVSIAAGRGARILPLTPAELTRRGGPAAVTHALGAHVAGRRGDPHAHFTLSPSSLGNVGEGDRLVLPSLNGATVARAAQGAPAVYTGCLRDASATAAAVAADLAAGRAPRVTIVAVGEQWSSVADDARVPGAVLARAYRPSLEDWIGAGAIAARLRAAGLSLSAEAGAAAAAWDSADLPGSVTASVSGRELAAKGFAADLGPAVEVDAAGHPTRLFADGWFAATG